MALRIKTVQWMDYPVWLASSCPALEQKLASNGFGSKEREMATPTHHPRSHFIQTVHFGGGGSLASTYLPITFKVRLVETRTQPTQKDHISLDMFDFHRCDDFCRVNDYVC